jgi:hypothetical protein
MVEFMVNIDFFLGIFVINLIEVVGTNLIATTSPVVVFFANLTYPYEPKPTMFTLPV